MEETHVVTCFLRNRGEVLLLRRSEEVGTYVGKWGGVAGHAEGDPDAAAREEIDEESGLLDACTLARRGVPFEFTDSDARSASESREPPGDPDPGVRWVVHPYLFDCEHRDVETNRETTEAEWVHPTEILRRETVPKLWASYSRVAPTVERVAEDAEHGSAYLSVRALEVLRDRAGSFAEREGAGWSQLTAIAEKLLDARPSMAAVANRVNRAMAEASAATGPDEEAGAAAVERAAREGIERAYRADERAAENAAAEIRERTVLTLSRSGTVLDALPAARRVFVAESRPAREGVGVAEALAAGADGDGATGDGAGENGETEGGATEDEPSPDVTLHTDAAVAHVLATEDVDAVVVGADAVLPDGRVVNKTGTRGTALAASREGIPVYAVAATDKVRTDDEVHLEDGDPTAVYDGDAEIDVRNPTFDATPAAAMSGIVTERGVLDGDDVSAVAAELRELAAWRSGD